MPKPPPKPTPKTRRPVAVPTTNDPVAFAEQRIRRVSLGELHFDEHNPRFAGESKEGVTEAQILNEIVKTFGVDDVICSIAMNGYLETEPLVGLRRREGGIRIVEGNRRLAALLVLGRDPRARDQNRLAANHPLAPGVAIGDVPVVVYDEGTEPRQLLPYLGVRHIVGPRSWDSYAKAAWVAGVVGNVEGGVTLKQIEQMIGDARGTIRRMLEGYYLVKQVRDAQLFNFEDSTVKGRGTAASFPFSWVYNILGYTNARHFVGMLDDRIKPDPVPPDMVPSAADLMGFMFGQKAGKKQACIRESRELSDLAVCLGKPQLVARLRNGEVVSRVLWSAKAGGDKFLQSIAAADQAMSEAANAAPELTRDEAMKFAPQVLAVVKRSRSLHKTLAEKATDIEDDE